MTENRKRRRVTVGFPVKVTGTDAAGKPFEEMCRTINVSSAGVKFPMRNSLHVHDTVTVTLPLPKEFRPIASLEYAYTARGMVARLDEIPTQPGMKAVLVKFLK